MDKAILEKERNSNFTQINNVACQDTKLSFKARWLYLYLWSLPDSREIYISDLVTRATDWKDSVNSWLCELEDNWYLIRWERERKENWWLWWYKWTIHEESIYWYNLPSKWEKCEKWFRLYNLSSKTNSRKSDVGKPADIKYTYELNTQNNFASDFFFDALDDIQEVDIPLPAKEQLIVADETMTIDECISKVHKLYKDYKLLSRYVRSKVTNSIKKKYEEWILWEDIVSWLEIYLEECKQNKTEKNFVLHATTFINQNRREWYEISIVKEELKDNMLSDMSYEIKWDGWYIVNKKDYKTLYKNAYWKWWEEIWAKDYNDCKMQLKKNTTFTFYKHHNG